jgi:hypothetical protein
MHDSTMNAGKASPMKSQLTLVAFSIIIAPTTIRTEPVAQEGMLLRIGAKKILMKNQKLVAIAVRPVFPPSPIPLADSLRHQELKSVSCSRCVPVDRLTNEGSARRRSEEQAGHGNTCGIHQEGNRTTLKVPISRVKETGLLRHGNQSTGGVQKVDVKERDLKTKCGSVGIDSAREIS